MRGQERRNHVSVRLEPEILDRVDALIPCFTTPKHVGTRSDVVRALILGGLEHHMGGRSTVPPEPQEPVSPLGRPADD
jgi:hypothetical protein